MDLTPIRPFLRTVLRSAYWCRYKRTDGDDCANLLHTRFPLQYLFATQKLAISNKNETPCANVRLRTATFLARLTEMAPGDTNVGSRPGNQAYVLQSNGFNYCSREMFRFRGCRMRFPLSARLLKRHIKILATAFGYLRRCPIKPHYRTYPTGQPH
jgi:hypothetical protein